MLSSKEIIAHAKRSEYRNRHEPTMFIRISYYMGRSLNALSSQLRRRRRWAIEHRLRFMFTEGQHVTTPHGTGTVVKMQKLVDSDGLGGFVEVHVKYDTKRVGEPWEEVGKYNQVFLSDGRGE